MQFFLSLHHDTLLLSCGDVKLHGSVMGTGIPGDHQQWFEEFRVLLSGKEKLRVRIDPFGNLTTSSNLSTIAVFIEGSAVRQVVEIVYDGFEINVAQNQAVRIGGGFSETVHFSAGPTQLEITSAVATKEQSTTLQLKYMHLDIGFASLNTTMCTEGVLAEIWGTAPISNTTAMMLRPPAQ